MNRMNGVVKGWFVVVLGMVVGVLGIPTAEAATYSGGSGILGDPYLISTSADLLTLAGTSADWASNFLMTNDIDMTGVSTFTPIGNGTTKFTGVFDGGGYAIQNLVIDLPAQDYVGVFGYVSGASAEIKNLGIQGSNVTGNNYVGGVAGYNYSGAKITSCHVIGIVTGIGRSVGGLIGNNYGTVTSCYATGSVISSDVYIGGLIGNSASGTVTYCFASATVIGISNVGGLVGDSKCAITSCYATGMVEGTGGTQNNIGGLVGMNWSGTVTSCYAIGEVKGTGSFVGGLIGCWNDGIIACSFWDVELTGSTNSSGGKGLTTAQMKTLSIFQNAGWSSYGWVMANGEYPRLNWEGTGMPTIPAPDPVPLSGSGTEIDPYLVNTPAEFALLSWYIDLLDAHILLNADLDCTGVTIYPIGDLGIAFKGVFDGGGYNVSNIFLSSSSNYLGIFSQLGAGGEIHDFEVENISINGHSYVGGLVGSNKGTLTSCCVSGTVTCTGKCNGGLVGQNDGTVMSCCASGTIVATDYFTGGLVGKNMSTVASSYSTSTVTTVNCGGGLVGTNHSGMVTSCYATGMVTGTGMSGWIGGLIGQNANGTITSCYAKGAVTGNYHIGGLVGQSDKGTITSCYASGTVTGSLYTGGLVGRTQNDSYSGLTIFSFWDVETSGNTGSSGGSGLTTDQMKTLSIFQNAGWSSYGWVMANGEYPRLNWEGTGMPTIPAPDPVPLSGSGTEIDPYLVSTPEEFSLLSWRPEILDAHILLTADLDCAGVTLYPIGPFTGVFDGANKVISNVNLDYPENDYVGLFSIIGVSGEIKSLSILDIAVKGRSWIGGLVGENRGKITSCNVSGSVISNMSNYASIGGLVGKNYGGTIISCYTKGNISGWRDTGGLVGLNHTGTVTSCYSMGSVTGNNFLGGLFGQNWTGTVTSCYSMSSVTGNNDLGGLIGLIYSGGMVTKCYSTGSVEGTTNVGGLVGGAAGTITSCYATGSVSGTDEVGGLIGSGGSTTRCYATGSVSGNTNLGGLIGGTGTVTSSFWDTETGGPNNGRGTGLPTAQMKQRTTFESAGWDFATTWYIFENLSYPNLTGIPMPIDSIESLQALAYASGGSFFLTRDINARTTSNWSDKSGYPGFVPIGTAAQPFNGILDGNGHHIFGLHINRPDLDGVGLFGHIGTSGVVRGIGLDDASITGGNQTGGLAGMNEGTIDQCYVQGSITGLQEVGGLVGVNSGTVTETYAAATVQPLLAGGPPPQSLGGLIGEDSGGSVTTSFWDTDVSGILSSGGGTGAPTTTLQSEGTYTTAGWDMTGTWALVEGVSYPYFRNSISLVVLSSPPRLINADTVDINIQSFLAGLFVTIGGGAYPAYHKFDTAGQDSITVSLRQEAINDLVISTVSETGEERIIAEYRVFESNTFPKVSTPVSSLQLSPASLSLPTSGTQQFICVATFADGTTAAVAPVCNWNTSGGTITSAGLYTHGTDPVQLQALLHTENGWVSSNTAVVTTSKGGDDKAGNGLVSGVVRSHYTGLGLPDANMTVYNVYSTDVAAQYNMYDTLGNYMFFMPEGIYHFEGATAGFRSETKRGGYMIRNRELLNPGPPEVWSEPEYSGKVKSNRPLQYNFDLRPNDAQAPWVYYVEPPASCTVKEPLLVVTAINADKYSELGVANFTLNSNAHSVRDNISTTGFYRNTWSLELGLNTLRLYTMDTEGNASERSIEVIYDPDYDPSGYVPPDPDGPPATDCVAMALTSPRDGTSLRGNAVTLYAEALGGDLGAVAAVSFEARGSGTGDAWVMLGVTLVAPHALVWNTSLYPEGTYQLRAVAISQDGCVDSTASVIDVTVASDAPYYQRVEAGTHYLTAPVSATSDTIFTLWDGTRFARITVPSGAVASNDTLTAFFPNAGLYTPALTTWQQDADLYLDVSLQHHTGDFLGGKHATLEVGYPDNNGDDLVDVSELRVPLLQLRYLPAPASSFVGLPISTLSRNNRCITGETSHFSTFGIVEEQPAPPLNLLTDTLPNGFVGLAYTQLLTADGGEAPYTWTVVSGALPAGLNINGNSLEGTPTAAGDYSFTLQVADVQSPPYTITRSFTVTIFDADQPTVTVEYAIGQQGNANTLPIRWAITFSEPVTGFDASDITLEGTASSGAVYSVTGSGAVYQLEITTLPYDGALRPHVAAGGAQSVATGAPCVASSRERWVWMDRRVPLAVITSVYAGLQEYGVSGPIVVETLPIIFQLTFDEYVTGLDAGDIGFAETIPGLTYEVNGSAKSYTLTITNIDSATTVTPLLLAGAAVDMAGNGIALTPYTGREVQYIPPALPSVTLNQQTGQADPTNGLPILFDIVFSAPVIGFDAAGVTPIGTALNPLYTVTGSGANYTLTVTDADSDGTVAFRIPETVDWLPSTSLDNVVLYDTTGPGLVIGAPSPDRSWKGPVSFPVQYNSAGSVSLTTGDITLEGVPTATVSVTGTGTQQRVVTLSGINGAGTLGISISGGTATDVAGNLASASGSSPVVQVGPPPLVTVSRAVGQNAYVNTLPAVFDIVFDKEVFNFEATDIVMVGTAPNAVIALTGTGPAYTLTVTGTSGDGTLRPRVPAGVCEDSLGNLNEASTGADGVVTLDTTPPLFNNIAAAPSPAGQGAVVTLTFTASETLGGNPVVSVNGNAAVYDSKSGLDYTYRYTVLAGDPAGAATIAISGTDLAGNPGQAENNVVLVIDHSKPTANFAAAPLSGMPPLAVTFSDLSVAVPGTPLTDWAWNFGDGTPVVNGQAPALHTYMLAGVYTVTLTVTDAAMNSDDESKVGYIVVGGPTASFTATPVNGPLPLVVQFTDTSDPGADTITAWHWDFGDGDTNTEASPSHTYDTEGVYTVTLTVTTAVTGDTVVQTDLIEVLPGVSPTADFSGTPTSGAPPLTVVFIDASNPGSAPIEYWEWDFGDGDTSTDPLPTHVYANPGTYTVTLTVTTSQGSDTETKTDYIEVTVAVPAGGMTALAILATLLATCAAMVLQSRPRKIRKM
jgi:PKD repeat protein